MAIQINGNGTITGISSGGLPAGSVTAATLASGARGKILQVKQTVKTDTDSSTSLDTFVDISGFSVSITPSATTSKILVMVDVRLSAYTNRNVALKLLRDSTPIYVGDSAGSRSQVTNAIRITDDARGEMHTESATFLDSPSTTSATTYKVQWCHTYGGSSDGIYLNRSQQDTCLLYTSDSADE